MMVDELLRQLHDTHPDADADHMHGHIIECIAHKIGLPSYVISAETVIGHLKYIRRKQAEETDRLNKIRGAVTHT
jgi:hypothetical protein